MTRKTGLISMALIIGLLLGISIPAIAISGVNRRQNKRIVALEKKAKSQSRRIHALALRVGVIEQAPDTTTGLADNIAALKGRVDEHDGRLTGLREDVLGIDERLENHGNNFGYLFARTNQIDGNGVYYGVIRRSQVRLGENDGCANGQPRAATWDGGNLSC